MEQPELKAPELVRRVPIPGPVHRIEREIQKPNFVSNIHVQESASNLFEVCFPDPDTQFREIENVDDHVDIKAAISELSGTSGAPPSPVAVQHWHVQEEQYTTFSHCHCSASAEPKRATDDRDALVYCTALTEGMGVTTGSQSNPLPQWTSELAGTNRHDRHFHRGSASTGAIVADIRLREYSLANGKTHFVYDVYERAPTAKRLCIKMQWPVVKEVISESPVTVPLCVAEETYEVPDETRVIYEDTFYWQPVVQYDATKDPVWQTRGEVFTEILEPNHLQANAIEAFRLKRVKTSNHRTTLRR